MKRRRAHMFALERKNLMPFLFDNNSGDNIFYILITRFYGKMIDLNELMFAVKQNLMEISLPTILEKS